MRFAMRALILLALPAVAFSWLFQIRIPRMDVSFGYVSFEPRDYLLDALTGAAPYVAVLVVLAAVAYVFGGPKR